MKASTEQVWTIRSIIKWTQQYFKDYKIATPGLDAELLLAFACQCSRMDLYLNHDKPLLTDERELFRKLVKKRVQGTPVAYLVGEKGFWTLTLFVENGVLIPRPDTEILVEETCSAIKRWQELHQKKKCVIIEIGTGTGAIPLALCSSLKNLKIVSVEISDTAVKVASKNANHYSNLLSPRSNSLHLIRGDRFQMFHPATQFDFIISNPPYIPTSQIPQLQKEIVLHEPKQALDGGNDGLDFYRHFFQYGVGFLKVGGEMLLEIGFDQSNGVTTNLPDSMELIRIVEDLQSHPRVWHGKRCPSKIGSID